MVNESAEPRRPRIRLDRIFTRQGDDGMTLGPGGERVWKNDLRIECLGALDELNVHVGLARQTAEDLQAGQPDLQRLSRWLARIQHELFNVGSNLFSAGAHAPRLAPGWVTRLEREIEALNAELEPLDSFVLPGGSRVSLELHLCRVACRRAERVVVALGRQQSLPSHLLPYLNRLSDAFFVWSRWANRRLGMPEELWDPSAHSDEDSQPA